MAGESIPDLLPPRGELSPSLWEQYGWLVVCAAILFGAVMTLLVVLLRQPKPVVVTPPDVLARRELEVLRGSPEDGKLLVKVSSIVRRHVALAFGLPPGELMTSELLRALESIPQMDAGLTANIGDFLRGCDERKFAPAPPAAPAGAVDRGLELLRKVYETKPQLQRPPVIQPLEASRT